MLKKENEYLKVELIKLSSVQQDLFINTTNKESSGLWYYNTDKELIDLKSENSNLKKNKDNYERQNINLKNENQILISKLNNLESVFIGSNIIRNKDGSVSNEIGDDYNTSAVLLYKLVNFRK